MKKGFLVFYVVLSLIVFFTGIQSLFSGYGGKVGKAGDIFYCSKAFPGTCTQGACTATDNTFGNGCTLYRCRGRCLTYDKTMECTEYVEHDVTCTKPNNGGGGSSDWGDNCDPVMSEIYGECIIVPPRI